ncbi:MULTISPECIES: hypothetical protein [Actinoplanes]|uniref:hypothetical protein n=1 Tax=Actinoplanes TaxID=1865 RepID=UPI0005F29816|nr:MULTISPECIES: hypothetical protein [Actinoplanes]GLY04878.1 hypothetical protein Acsp01_52570 [Actinoplanes sp. NBRC 101535]
MSDTPTPLPLLGEELEPARMEALVVRLRTVEQERDAWRQRHAGAAEERDEERAMVRQLRGSGSYRLGRALVSFVRDPLRSSPRLLRRLASRVRRRKAKSPRKTRKATPKTLPTHLYVALGLDLPALRSFVLAVQQRLLVEADHRAVVLTDEPSFSLLRKVGLIIEYLPDRQSWQRHRPARPWDGVLAERLAHLCRDHTVAQVIFVDPDHPPVLAELLRKTDTTPPVQRSLQQM